MTTTTIISEIWAPIPGTHPDTRWEWTETDRRQVDSTRARRSFVAAVDRMTADVGADDISRQGRSAAAAEWDGVTPITITASSWNGTKTMRVRVAGDPFEPVGAVEIAARLGVRRSTVDQWQQRGLLPVPTWTVGGRPAWAWSTIEAWASSTGRL